VIRSVWRRDSAYPALLREIPDPPERLYLTGKDLELGPGVAVVGARRASRYGLQVAHGVAAELAAAGVTIVSGLARGIDAAAHRGALSVGGSTVAVLGCGLDVCYPVGNRGLFQQIAEEGSLISEYEAGTRPLPFHFPVRNRIIAGMCLGVVVVEGTARGGAMITARLAMEYGREVFAVPGAVHADGSQGPHLLIRDGARLAASAAHVLEDLGIDAPAPAGAQPLELEPDEHRLMGCLEAEPQLLDVIARKGRIPASTATAILVKLEMKALVTRHAGGRYSRSVQAAGS
jgi:DNA processing protein